MSLKEGDLVEVLVDGIWEKRIYAYYNSEFDDFIICVKKGSEKDYLNDKPFKTNKYKIWRLINENKCCFISCIHPSHDCDNCLENPEFQERLKLIKNQNDRNDEQHSSDGILNKLKCFLGNNEIFIKAEIIIKAITLYEEYKKRIQLYKKIQMSYNDTKSCINISIYKKNDEYIYFKFNNKGIKYYRGMFINNSNYHQDFKKISNFTKVLDTFENLDIMNY